MAEAFTVFEKFGDVCAELLEPDRKELIYAINMYGMFGEEVELPYLLKALFTSLKEDIDNSKSMRARGSKGGRPKSKPQVSETEEPEVSETEKPVVSESEEPQVSDDCEKSESQSNPNQTNPIQSIPNQKKREKKRVTVGVSRLRRSKRFGRTARRRATGSTRSSSWRSTNRRAGRSARTR